VKDGTVRDTVIITWAMQDEGEVRRSGRGHKCQRMCFEVVNDVQSNPIQLIVRFRI
jgi:hypothetical protein